MRPTFDRRLWILLFWYFILQCISPTDQQGTSKKSLGQKPRELADTRKSTNIRIVPECANCSRSLSTHNQDVQKATTANREHSTEDKQKPHQHRHQLNKLHDGQQVNNVESLGIHKTNVQHEDDSLKGPLQAYRHGRLNPAVPPPQPPSSLPRSTTAAKGATQLSDDSETRSLVDNSHRQGRDHKDTTAFEFIDVKRENSRDANANSFLSHIFHKFSQEKVLGKRKFSSDISSSYGYEDDDLTMLDVDDNREVVGGYSENGVNSRVKRGTVPLATNGPAHEIASAKDIRPDQSNVIRSSDISKSDISYNETLSPNLNPPSMSDGTKASDLFVPQLPSPLPKTDVSNLTFSHNLDKSAISHSKLASNEPMIIIDDGGEEFDSGISSISDSRSIEEYAHDEPRVLPLRPIIRGPYDDEHDEESTVVYAEQHTEIKLTCDADVDIASTVWLKNGQVVHAMDRSSRVADYRFIKEPLGGLTITNVMLEDDGRWQCEAENSRGYVENARPIKLVVLDRPKPPYLLIDSRRLDAGNIFVPVKENSELSVSCICDGGNPQPTLTWEVLLSPGVDRHAQKVAAEVLELEEIKSEKEKEPYKINSGAKSEARLPAVYRAHHNARILCVMEHPTLKMRQNASLLLDVQYTPSFAISRTPGFGYPLREGIEVSLKCDVDSNPPSTPRWQKDDGDTPVPQTGDGFLNFTSIRREHSGWYKCTSRHLNFQYSSIGYYLSVRYDSVDVTSEPDDQEVSVAASHNPNKGQLEVQLGGAVTLQCPQGSLGCWSHLDPVTARLRGLGVGISTPTGQFSLKDVVYQDAGTYKCIGQSPSNKKKLEVLQTVGVLVKGAPTAVARNATPVAYPGSPLHLTVEFCANPAAYAARWLHGDRVYTPGNQYGSTVLAYGVTDLPTPFCKEARLTYVSMHERVPRTFYFIVSSPGGVAEAIFKVNFTLRYRSMSNSIDEEEEELSEPEEIHFPVFGTSSMGPKFLTPLSLQLLLLCIIFTFIDVLK